jgi:branched-chain amino acid transport system permease protein
MPPSLIAEQLLNGLQLGLMLFLLAAGLTLVFGIMDTINLAHGSLYMIGAYIAASVIEASGSFLLGIAAAIAGTALVGVALEMALLRRLYRRSHLSQVLATFAVILIANEIVRMIWGSQPILLSMPPALSGPVELLGLRYPAYRLVVIGVGLATAMLLYLLVTRTRAGMWVRAGASDREMAEVMGVDTRRLFTLVFAIGAALAAVAGMLFLMYYGLIDFFIGFLAGIKAFTAAVLGGIGSLPGAMLGGLLIGLIEVFWAGYFSSEYKDVAAFSILVLVLIFRPTGLLGKPEIEKV